MHKLYGPHRLLQAHLLGRGWGKGLGCGLALSVNENLGEAKEALSAEMVQPGS